MTEPAGSPPDAARGRSETRLRLLEAAATIIARDGYERASLADIARSAGLTTGAVYSTFGSKWALMRAVIASRLQPLALPTRAGSDELDLDRLVTDLAKAVNRPEGRQLAILQLEIDLLALRNPELLAELTEEAAAHHVRLTAQLTAMAAGGAALPLPADQLARLLISTVEGLQLNHLLDPDGVTEAHYAAALQLLLGRPDPA